jgi:arylsulfatase A-like enzyme
MLQTLRNPRPLIISLICIASFSCTTECIQKEIKKPNILVILTDDQGYPTTGPYGGNMVPQNTGYSTGIFGNWHLTTNEDGHYRGLTPEAASHYGFDISGPWLCDQELLQV